MTYSFTLVAIPYIAALFLSGFISIYSFVFFERTRTTILFSALSSSLTLWIFGILFEILSVELEIMIFWRYFRLIWINLAATFFLLFAITFTSFAPKIFSRPHYLLPLFIPAIFDYLLLITNNFHWLYFTEISLHPTAPFPALQRQFGVFYIYHILFIGTFISCSFIAFLQVYRRSLHRMYRRQFQFLFIGASIFIFVAIFNVLQVFPFSEYLDITPLAYMVTCFFVLFGMGEYHLIDVIPLANKIIISNLTKTGIIATDNNNRIIEMNPIAQEYLISSEKIKIIGESLFTITDSQTHLPQYIKLKFREIKDTLKEMHNNYGVATSFEIELIHPTSLQQEFFSISVEAIKYRERITGFMYILKNITPEKMIEAATRKSVDFKDSLLGVISHDLRNQLFVIHGFTEILRKELSKGPDKDNMELFEFLDGIDAKVDEASIVIKNVRNYLKLMGSFDEPVKPVIIDLKNILTAVLENFVHQIEDKQINLVINWPDSKQINTMADLRVRSVFNNILDNAVKWSPHKGKIEILIDQHESKWEFSISDEGPGVPDSLKDAIFKPFTSFGPADKQGSGLGLSITTEILQAFQGEISVEDNTPNGAKFKFTLPITSKKE